MANPRVPVLQDEYETLKRSTDGFDAVAADEARDLTPAERTDYDASITRMEAIEVDLQAIDKREARAASVAATHTRAVNPVGSAARTAPRPEVPTMGEQLLTRAKASLGKDVEAAETLTRVLAHGVFADGLQPTTIEGDLIKFVDISRNAVNASRRLPMPQNHADTFKRPRASQLTTDAIQVAQGDVLSSQAFKVVGDTVTKKTYGATLALSEQEIDWTDPALLALATQDMAQQYGVVTDKVLTTAIEAASTASVQTVVSNTCTAAQFNTAVAAAASTAYGTSKQLPDTLFCAPDRFFYLAGLSDTTGRAAFPSYGQLTGTFGANPGGLTEWTGMTIQGLRVVVDPNFTAGLWTVAVSNLVESYEQEKGLLTIASPSTLETIIAYRGYFAANVYTQGFGALETI